MLKIITTVNIPFFNYNVTNQSNRLDVYIDGNIVNAPTQELYREWFNDETSVSFKSFRQQVLDSGLRNIRITINSMGGQVGDAMAMHDFIKDLENKGYTIETIGMGMICSAATYILSASKNSKISENSYYMIHNVSGGVQGDVNEIENYSRTLRQFNNDVRDYYCNLTGKSADEITNLMNAETWFNGKQAVENKFVKSLLIEEEKFENSISTRDWMFNNTTVLNAYNALVKVPENLDENFNIKDMNKIVEAIVNAFKTNKLVVTDSNASAEPLTVETLTGALNKAFEGVDLTPTVPAETVDAAVSNFFTAGLPENILNQIKEAVKSEPVNLEEDEAFVNLGKRLGDVEQKIANNTGGAKPKGTSTQTPVEDKYETEGIGWGEAK